MLKCCVCGKPLTNRRSWVCGTCALAHHLPLDPDAWPAWAKAERQREASRRRFEPSFGVSGNDMSYTPYRRQKDNKAYRTASRVHKSTTASLRRTSADDLLYSSDDSASPSHDYTPVLESLPSDLRQQLLQHAERQTILADAIRSLPRVSQRAILETLIGKSVEEIAADEGLSDTTMRWLLNSAERHLCDLLSAKMDADNGTRYH